MGKLAGIVVVDFTQLLAGPMATAILAQQGATVIKIEPPAGDPTRAGRRSFAEQADGDTFLTVNRGKRSIALDLKRADDLDVAERLIAAADVVVESFRPGVADRLGIGYDRARHINPDIVYCSLSAFGAADPAGAHDGVIQAMAGLLDGGDGPPVDLSVSLASIAAAHHASIGILSALHGVRAGQGGDCIDIALYDAALALNAQRVPAALGTRAEAGSPLTASYRAGDGLWLRLDARNGREQASLSEALGLPVIDGGALAARFAQEPRRHWLDRLEGSGVAGPVLSLAEALASERAGRRGLAMAQGDDVRLASPIRFANAGEETGRAPRLDEHRSEILHFAGMRA